MNYSLFPFNKTLINACREYAKAKHLFQTQLTDPVQVGREDSISADLAADIFFLLDYRTSMSEAEIREQAGIYQKIFNAEDAAARNALLNRFLSRLETLDTRKLLQLFDYASSAANMPRRLIQYFIAVKAAFSESVYLRNKAFNQVYKDTIGNEDARREAFEKKSDFLKLHAYHMSSLLAYNEFPVREFFPDAKQARDPGTVNLEFRKAYSNFIALEPELITDLVNIPELQETADIFRYDPQKLWNNAQETLPSTVQDELSDNYGNQEAVWRGICSAIPGKSDQEITKSLAELQRLEQLESSWFLNHMDSYKPMDPELLRKDAMPFCINVDRYLNRPDNSLEKLLLTYPLPAWYIFTDDFDLHADRNEIFSQMNPREKGDFYIKKALIGIQMKKAEERQKLLRAISDDETLSDRINTKLGLKITPEVLSTAAARYCRLQKLLVTRQLDIITFSRYPKIVQREAEAALDLFHESVLKLCTPEGFEKLSIEQKADSFHRDYGRIILNKQGHICDGSGQYKALFRNMYLSEIINDITPGTAAAKTELRGAIDALHILCGSTWKADKQQIHNFAKRFKAPISPGNNIALSIDITCHTKEEGQISPEPVTTGLTWEIIDQVFPTAIAHETSNLTLDRQQAYAGLFRLNLADPESDSADLLQKALIFKEEAPAENAAAYESRKSENIRLILDAINHPTPKRSNREKFDEIYDAWLGLKEASKGKPLTPEDHQKFIAALDKVNIRRVALGIRGKTMQDAYKHQREIYKEMKKDLHVIINTTAPAPAKASLPDGQQPDPVLKDNKLLLLRHIVNYPEGKQKLKIPELQLKLYTNKALPENAKEINIGKINNKRQRSASFSKDHMTSVTTPIV